MGGPVRACLFATPFFFLGMNNPTSDMVSLCVSGRVESRESVSSVIAYVLFDSVNSNSQRVKWPPIATDCLVITLLLSSYSVI